MNKKTLQRTLCFLLALCFCFSIAIKPIEAQAAAAVPWMVYALITYMAAVGITFTVSGGVEAMVDAVESAVKDYEQQNNIIDFYDIMRERNIRFVPNNNKDPNGNPLYDLFFTATAVEGIQAFLNWLTTDGGWIGPQIATTNTGTFTAFVNGNEEIFATSYGLTQVSDYLYDVEVINSVAEVPVKYFQLAEGEYLFPPDMFVYTNSRGYGVNFYGVMKNDYTTPTYKSLYLQYAQENNYKLSFNLNSRLVAIFPNNPLEHVEGITLAYNPNADVDSNFPYAFYIVLDNGQLLYAFDADTYTATKPVDFAEWTSEALMTPPDVIPEIYPLPNEGVSIKDAISVPMGDPSLIEWAERVEETFIETGTIPKPIPQVVPDPDVTPDPTPVPTPVPTPNPSYDDIEDLGLPSLGEALINKFPFCLPSDIGRIMDVFTAEPITPYWQVDLFSNLGGRVPFVGDTAIEIDFTEYEELGTISRWTTTIGYCLFLLLITRQMITW